MALTASLTAALTAALTLSVASAAQLTLRGDDLKIAIFTDLHFGENEAGTWGPEQDVSSARVMRNVLASEGPDLDLIVYLGDQVTGSNVHENATAYWERAIAPCVDVNQT